MILLLITCMLSFAIPYKTSAEPKDYLTQGFNPAIDQTQTYPPDVSFCIVDLKYKKNDLKICEFGQGVLSGFHGFNRLYGGNRIWTELWKFLSDLKMPIFYVGTSQRPPGLVPDALINRSNIFSFSNITATVASESFQRATRIKRSIPNTLSDTAGILISKKVSAVYNSYQKVEEAFPGVIALDFATKLIVLNKLKTHLLFLKDPELEKFRPQCCIMPATYSADMAHTVISTIPSKHYVIKPIAGFKGAGIIFCTPEELDATFKVMFQKTHPLHASLPEEYEYWQSYDKPYFLVESLESSQPLTVSGKKYDATMRVAFGISYSHGTITIKFFGAYWKLPTHAINEKGSLSSRYKSHIEPKTNCSEKVDAQTFKEVTATLKKVLPKIYLKMIAATYDEDFLPSVQRMLGNSSILCSSKKHQS